MQLLMVINNSNLANSLQKVLLMHATKFAWIIPITCVCTQTCAVIINIWGISASIYDKVHLKRNDRSEACHTLEDWSILSSSPTGK